MYPKLKIRNRDDRTLERVDEGVEVTFLPWT